MEPGAAGETLATLIEEGSKALQSALQTGSHRKRGVMALQVLLHELGFGRPLESVELVADGDYGDATVLALRAFAKANASQAKGESVSLPLAQKILARYRSLEHLRRLDADIHDERRRSTKSSKAVTGYKKPHNGGDADKVKSLQILLNENGAGLVITSDYDDPTRDAVKPLAQTGNGRPLNLGAAQALVEKLSPKYGEHWRSPGVVRKGIGIGGTTGTISPIGSEIRDHTQTPKPVRKASPERDFSVNTGVTARLLDVKPVGQKLENWCWAASTQMMIGYLRSLGEDKCPTCGRSGNSDEDISQAAQMNRRLQDSEVNCGADRTADYDYKTCDRGGWPHFFEFQNQIRSTEWASKRHVLEERGLVLRDGGPRLRVRHRLSDWQVKALAYTSGLEFRKRLDDAEGAALTWEMLTYLLDHQRPVAFAFRYPHPSAGHMRLAVGYVVTPGDKRWVAVADPLPPGTGEVHLIPYEFYRDGPFDGHWRDYWVPPVVKDGSSAPDRCRHEELRVGRELLASYITYPDDPSPAKPKTDGEKPSKVDYDAAFLEAQEGFRAVEAIASGAERLAVSLGMGGAFTEAFLGLMGGKKPSEYGFRDLSEGDLVLHEEDRIPVYELTARELQKWEPASEKIAQLLDKPREIIYRITRPGQEPFPFFAAVTVRRKGAGWKLASLGKGSLMSLIEGKALSESFFGMFSKAPSLERFMKFSLYTGDLKTESGGRFTNEQIKEAMAEARNADEGVRSDRRKRRKKEIDDLARALNDGLTRDPVRYPASLWNERYSPGPEEDLKDDLREMASWASRLMMKLWDDKARKSFLYLSEDPAKKESLRELMDLDPAPASDKITGAIVDVLRDLLRGEERILSLWREWSQMPAESKREKDDKRAKLEELFEATRDQEIDCLTWREKFSRSEGALWDKLAARRQDAELDGLTGDPKPKYIVSVPELYQLLVAYSTVAGPVEPDDPTHPVEPVYPESFHRPERRVQSGTLLKVLTDLQDVANERKVMRAG